MPNEKNAGFGELMTSPSLLPENLPVERCSKVGRQIFKELNNYSS